MVTSIPENFEATVTLSQEDSYSILAKTECVFAAYWHDPQGVINTSGVAKYFEIEIEEICSVLEKYGEEFEIVNDGWTPRQAIHLGMLLNCPMATRVRSLALDVIEAHKSKSKRDAIAYLLKNTNFIKWSDREIAKILKCDHKTVGSARKELENAGKVVKFEKRTFNRNGKVIEQTPTKESTFQPASGEIPQMHTPNPDSFVEPIAVDNQERHPPTYSEEDLQNAIALAIQEAKIGFGVEVEEAALRGVQEQMNAQAIAIKSWKDEAMKLRSRIEEMEGLRQLETENQKLHQRIEELEHAVQERPGLEWGTTFSKQAEKVINKDVRKILENIDPDLDLRVLASTPPSRKRYREIFSLIEKAAYMLEIVPLAGRRCFRQGRYGTIADVNDETHLLEIDWDERKSEDSAGDLYPLNEIRVLPTIEGISEGTWVSSSNPNQPSYNYRGLVKEVRPKDKEVVIHWYETNKTSIHPVDSLRLIRASR